MPRLSPALLCTLCLLCPGLAAAQVQVGTVEDLIAAVAEATPGVRIAIRPGSYTLPSTLVLGDGGGVLYGAGLPNEVLLQVGGASEVVRVSAPGWTVSSMTLIGDAGVVVDSAGSGTLLRGLLIFNGTAGVVLGDPSDLICSLNSVVLANNVMAGLRGAAVEIYSGCDVQIIHQTTWDTGGSPIFVTGVSNSPRLVNNLWADEVFPSGDGDLVLPAPTDGSYFVDPINGDFHLIDGAPPIGAGVPVAAVGVDADGRPRKAQAPDVGAYEFTTAAPSGDGGVGGGSGGAAGGVGRPGGSASTPSCGCTVGAAHGGQAPPLRGALLTLGILALLYSLSGRGRGRLGRGPAGR